MSPDRGTGGQPDHLAACTACGEVYPVRPDDTGTLRPIGTDGACRCGNDEFVPVAEE